MLQIGCHIVLLRVLQRDQCSALKWEWAIVLSLSRRLPQTSTFGWMTQSVAIVSIHRLAEAMQRHEPSPQSQLPTGSGTKSHALPNFGRARAPCPGKESGMLLVVFLQYDPFCDPHF